MSIFAFCGGVGIKPMPKVEMFVPPLNGGEDRRGEQQTPIPTPSLDREGNKKAAFTLSEVLITLGIIGVVSTLTLPNLTNSYRRNVAMTKIEKGYAQLAQAYEQMMDNGGDYIFGQYQWAAEGETLEDGTDGSQNGRNYFNNYWREYLKSPVYCDTAEECGYPSNPTHKYRTGTESIIGFGPKSKAAFMTNEGIVYIVMCSTETWDTDELPRLVYMDINGGKGPNVAGRDLFIFIRTPNDGLMPFGYNRPWTLEDFRKECYGESGSPAGTDGGVYCAEYLRRNGWEAPRNYQF